MTASSPTHLQHEGQHVHAQLRHVPLGLGAADPDPNFIMSIFTTDQINSWSDCAWSNPQYDKLFSSSRRRSIR